MFAFGAWDPDSEAKSVAQDFISVTTHGNPAVLSQVAIFRLDPWEGQACPNGSWNAANQQSYKTWINNFAAGIGSARVALVLQPDLPFAVCAPSPVPLELVNYAAHRFNALPHTTVYIDAGARYFPAFTAAVSMLERAGISSVRGFALNTSEYDTTSSEVEYGARLVQALAAAGIRNKHFVVSTSQNGAGFLNGDYPGNVNDPRVCRNSHDKAVRDPRHSADHPGRQPPLAPGRLGRRPRLPLRGCVRVGRPAVAVRPGERVRLPARARTRGLDPVLAAAPVITY